MTRRTYITQCDSGGRISDRPCPALARLLDPAKWRCADCTRLHGPLASKEKKPW